MLQKKFAAFLLTGMLTAAVVCIPALASTSETAPADSAPASYPICTENGCSKTYDHKHDGTWYEGHHKEDCSDRTDSSTCTGKHSGTHHTSTSQSQGRHSHHTGTQTQASTATQDTQTNNGHAHHSHSGSHH
ncbi:hypothetical protein [Diplocloster modestus]|uniref:Uncharacterized protein n=1 Tax=Diplocloster modestus TaxID=2850322 RepID=A0ABS6K685_9FIRM|nr:hypothetical protein [Diplocloster modestus]MBU9726044.1 hypothetical protein [Diplocloster modestus]